MNLAIAGASVSHGHISSLIFSANLTEFCVDNILKFTANYTGFRVDNILKHHCNCIFPSAKMSAVLIRLLTCAIV